MRILATAGLSTTADTGKYFEEARAGFEGRLSGKSPEVVKSPHLTFLLPAMLSNGTLRPADVKAVLLPIRDLDQVAGSRTHNALRIGNPRGPGALFGTRRPTRQAEVLARGLSDLVIALEEYDVPYVFLLYPKFTRDYDYLWRRVGGFMDSVTEATMRQAWNQCIDHDLTQAIYPSPTIRDDARLYAKYTLHRLRRRPDSS